MTIIKVDRIFTLDSFMYYDNVKLENHPLLAVNDSCTCTTALNRAALRGIEMFCCDT